MNDKNNDRDSILSKEDVAIINATYKLYEIIILHRIYNRGGGKHQFTRGALASARSALVGLQPSEPGTNPVRIVALAAKNNDLAKSAILYAVEGVKKAKQEMLDKIKATELSDTELKSLSDVSPIFKMFESVTRLDKLRRELGQAHLVARVAHLASELAERIRLEPEHTDVEAA